MAGSKTGVNSVFSERNDGVMGSVERTREIRRRRARKSKLIKLRAKFAKATNESDKAVIQAKARRVSPLVSLSVKTDK